MKVYAGIGARDTPPEILGLMTVTAQALALAGWRLRSGHAPGADQAWEQGAGAQAEIYLPWPGFEGDIPVQARYVRSRPLPEAVEIASRYHPGWEHLRRGPRSLMGRNVHQVLGWNLERPVPLVICWTPDGSLDGSSRASGGTGQALRVCRALAPEARVFNLALPEHRERVEQFAAALPPSDGD